MRKKFGEVQIKRYMYVHKRRLANYQDNLFTGFNSACFFRLAKASVKRACKARDARRDGSFTLAFAQVKNIQKLKTPSAGDWLG